MFPPVSSTRNHLPLIVHHLCPQVIDIPKISAEDTVLVASNASGDKTTIPVPRGAYIAIHTPGLHYNRSSALF